MSLNILEVSKDNVYIDILHKLEYEDFEYLVSKLDKITEIPSSDLNYKYI